MAKTKNAIKTYTGIKESSIAALLNKQLEHFFTDADKIRSRDNELVYNLAIDIFFAKTNNLDFAGLNFFCQGDLIDLINSNASGGKDTKFRGRNDSDMGFACVK